MAYDEDIPTLTTVAAAHAKPFQPKVNSILVEPDICYGRDFILPKPLHDYIFRFVDEEDVARGEELHGKELGVMEHEDCAREEREEGARPYGGVHHKEKTGVG